ncbi:MAG: polysaccharide biosynthesis protein [Actinomycetia bacterium]|nr:polysaccharide biosynthesis protein [Actinomycetes bacterium]
MAEGTTHHTNQGQNLLWQRLSPKRRLTVWLVDMLGWVGATSLAWAMDQTDGPSSAGIPEFILVAIALTTAGLTTGLYRGRWRLGSFEESSAVAAVGFVTSCTFAGLLAILHTTPTPAELTITGLGGTGVMSIYRTLLRRRDLREVRPSSPDLISTIVFGAGTGGELAVRAMLRDPSSPYLPVAILDDDLSKHRMRIDGVPVIGGRGRLEVAIASSGATMMIIAVPSASGQLISELFDLGHELGLDVRALPTAEDLFGRRVRIDDIRELRESDLLGRHRIETDVNSIAGYVSGRRVLITGAGGSIGSELSRQVSRYGPSKLFLLDRDESALHAVQLSIHGRALLDSDELVLANIRDRDRLEQVFDETKPDVIFHAAALKHLPLLERFPAEALQTNTQATVNLLELAALHGVSHFINVSSDKAADPISVLGYSKRLSERLTSFMDECASGQYVSVRFGNVLGSRGSVLTAFHKQALAGAPLTVTHPEVARYFMTVEEAVELVIQAGAIGTGGEVLVLDMGEPVRIVDVARRLAAQAGREAEIVYTGLRPGEKLVEDLFASSEVPSPTAHELIKSAPVPSLDPALVMMLDTNTEPAEVVNTLWALCENGTSLIAYERRLGEHELAVVPDRALIP